MSCLDGFQPLEWCFDSLNTVDLSYSILKMREGWSSERLKNRKYWGKKKNLVQKSFFLYSKTVFKTMWLVFLSSVFKLLNENSVKRSSFLSRRNHFCTCFGESIWETWPGTSDYFFGILLSLGSLQVTAAVKNYLKIGVMPFELDHYNPAELPPSSRVPFLTTTKGNLQTI